MFNLSGKVALITGATSGIGAQQARALSKAGASVILLGRRENRLKKVCDELNKQGRTADHIHTLNPRCSLNS